MPLHAQAEPGRGCLHRLEHPVRGVGRADIPRRGGDLRLDRVTITANVAGTLPSAGGLAQRGGSLLVTDSVISGNSKGPQDLYASSGEAGENRLLALQGFFKAHTLARPGYKVPYGR